jgi:hypothetical protein
MAGRQLGQPGSETTVHEGELMTKSECAHRKKMMKVAYSYAMSSLISTGIQAGLSVAASAIEGGLRKVVKGRKELKQLRQQQKITAPTGAPPNKDTKIDPIREMAGFGSQQPTYGFGSGGTGDAPPDTQSSTQDFTNNACRAYSSATGMFITMGPNTCEAINKIG